MGKTAVEKRPKGGDSGRFETMDGDKKVKQKIGRAQLTSFNSQQRIRLHPVVGDSTERQGGGSKRLGKRLVMRTSRGRGGSQQRGKSINDVRCV